MEEKEPIYIDSLTFDDINDFVKDKFKGQTCPLCGTTDQPSPIGTLGKIVFSSLKGLDADGEHVYGNMPTIPLLCENCGHLMNISPTLLVLELEKKQR